MGEYEDRSSQSRLGRQKTGWYAPRATAGPAVYSTLALKGYFPLSMLKTLNTPGTRLPSHCDKNLTPGVDMTTGSLGQGSSAAAGIALGNRLKGRNNKTFLILGDGELQEGQVWEAALFAAQQKLDNLIAFVDYNKQQLDGYVRDINNLGTSGQNLKASDGMPGKWTATALSRFGKR